MVAHRQEIVPWQTIRDRFQDGLIVGNGGSMAVDARFGYRSLYAAASDYGRLSPEVQEVFARFQTQDFELVLRRLWQAQLVNVALGIAHGPVEQAYLQVRSALIETIQAIHVTYEEASPSLIPIAEFLRQFRIVVSLNYDLIIYWAAMRGNQVFGNWFKDGFGPIRFSENWRRLQEPYGAPGATLYFYAHGNLALARTGTGHEIKILAQEQSDLLATVLRRWTEGQAVPLFVCEGTSAQKREAISTSGYLQEVADGPLCELGDSLVIYGWAMGEQEDHLLSTLRRSPPDRIAVSVHGNDHAYIDHVQRRLCSFALSELSFFAADSPGCWNQPGPDHEAEG